MGVFMKDHANRRWLIGKPDRKWTEADKRTIDSFFSWAMLFVVLFILSAIALSYAPKVSADQGANYHNECAIAERIPKRLISPNMREFKRKHPEIKYCIEDME